MMTVQWLEAQSAYRTAQATKISAKDAATYADGMYNKYATAVSEGQSQYDRDKPKLDEEMVQLQGELPILEEVLGLISSLTGGGAAAKGNEKAILALANTKILSLVPPRADTHLGQGIKELKTVLQAADASTTSAKMVAVIEGLQAQIQSRIAQLQTQMASMDRNLAADRASKTEWEIKMVDLNDEHDKAANDEATADLTRNSLGGQYMVKDEAYQNFHSTFGTETDELSRQQSVVQTVLDKISTFIASC